MIERIFKNWKTTTLGLLIIIISLLLVWFGKATFSEASVGLVGLLGFFFKDDILNNKALLALPFLFISCRSYKESERIEYKTDTLRIETMIRGDTVIKIDYKDTLIVSTKFCEGMFYIRDGTKVAEMRDKPQKIDTIITYKTKIITKVKIEDEKFWNEKSFVPLIIVVFLLLIIYLIKKPP